MERYVCQLYGGKGDDVNSLRSEIFWRTLKKKNRVIDLLHLPPCKASLKLHTRRSNYIAKIWRQAENDMIVYEHPLNHGWNSNYSLQWVNELYPTDVGSPLTSDEIMYESDYETDSEDEIEEIDDE